MSDGASSGPGAERRQHERFELLAQVELRRGGDLEAFTVLNISAGGLLLRNDRNVEFTIGEAIRVHLDVPELSIAFALDAKVIRVVGPTSKPAALAAMWTSSDVEASASLAQLLWSLKQA